MECSWRGSAKREVSVCVCPPSLNGFPLLQRSGVWLLLWHAWLGRWWRAQEQGQSGRATCDDDVQCQSTERGSDFQPGGTSGTARTHAHEGFKQVAGGANGCNRSVIWFEGEPGVRGVQGTRRSPSGGQLRQVERELNWPAMATDPGEPRMEYVGHTCAFNTQSDQTEAAAMDSGPVS